MRRRLPAGFYFWIAAFSLALVLGGFANRAFTRGPSAGRLDPAAGQANLSVETATGSVPGTAHAEVSSAPLLPETESAAEETTAPAPPAQTQPVPVPAAPKAAKAPSSPAVTDLYPGMPQRDMLRSSSDVKYYRFTADSRGAFSYTVSASQKTDLSSRIVSLYQVYYVNGMDGERDVRLLNRMQAYTTEAQTVSPNIGIIPGEYLLAVQAGAYADLGVYTISVSFTPGTEYEIECNNTVTRYTEIFSGVPVRGSACALAEGTDTDWFLIRMHMPGALELSFSHAADEVPAAAAFRVSVYNAEQKELYSGVSAREQALLESGALGVPAGDYFICVESRTQFTGDYILTVTKNAADLYEKEPNDTKETASVLSDGRAVAGALTEKNGAPDLDYFRFALTEPGSAVVSLSAAPQAPDENDPDRAVRRVTLTDVSGRVLFSSLMLQSEGSLTSGEIGLRAGTYYVLVDHTDLYATAADYLLRVRFAAREGCEQEPNDYKNHATALLPASPVSAALSDRETDYDTDWFTFTLKTPSTVRMTLAHAADETEETLFAAALFNAAGVQMTNAAGAEGFESRGADTLVSSDYVLSPGTYFLRVAPGVYAKTGNYTVAFAAAGE